MRRSRLKTILLYFASQFSVYTKFGVELGGLIDLFEKTCFGGYVPDESEWKMIYAGYKAQWKKLTKREKTTLELDKNM